MPLQNSIRERISKHKTCVVIPTYNNHKTLQRVIQGVLDFTNAIIIVNDGSTDATSTILESYQQLTIVSIHPNQGKGNALRQGFKKAIEMGYDYALTIDSDGQHYPDDIPVFIEALEQEGRPVLLIGNRNMEQEGVPKKSSFGNKFSNFWFWFETGIKLEDTQSGFRLYPLQRLPKRFFTKKFEFEIEVIVRAAWKDVPVKNVPIKILYHPNERVSHFRPFQDFTRISILNTILVIITLFYIKPRNFFRSFKKKSFKAFIKEDVLENNDSNAKKAFSVALGVFIGVAPFWGFQTVLAISGAVLFRLNKVITFAASNISIPPMIPIIIYGSLVIGNFILGTDEDLIFDASLSLDAIQQNVKQYILGSFVLATLLSVFFGIATFLLFNYFTTFKNKKG